jgi:hypothetical protein
MRYTTLCCQQAIMCRFIDFLSWNDQNLKIIFGKDAFIMRRSSPNGAAPQFCLKLLIYVNFVVIFYKKIKGILTIFVRKKNGLGKVCQKIDDFFSWKLPNKTQILKLAKRRWKNPDIKGFSRKQCRINTQNGTCVWYCSVSHSRAWA